MKAEDLPELAALQPEDDVRTKEAKLRKTYLLDLDTGLWNRVRKHQVKPYHTHYYDDETGEWYEVKR